MLNSGRKLSLIAALVALSLLVVAPGCTGFFVNQPNTVTVTPNAPSLTSGQTQAFSAQATYSDNSTKNVTASATWTTSDPCIVAILASGTGAGNATDIGTGGSATITASFNGVSGTATAAAPTGLTISPCQPQKAVTTGAGTFPQVVFNVGQTGVVFTAASSGTSAAATWTSSNPSIVNFASASSGAAIFPGAGTATITATANPLTGTLFITVQ